MKFLFIDPRFSPPVEDNSVNLAQKLEVEAQIPPAQIQIPDIIAVEGIESRPKIPLNEGIALDKKEPATYNKRASIKSSTLP